MSISRRKFVKAGALVLLAAGVPSVAAGKNNDPVAAGKSALGLNSVPLSGVGTRHPFTQQLFAPHLNSLFRIHANSGVSQLKLIQVSDQKAAGKKPGRIAGKECFSLLFVGYGQTITQDSYRVEHDALGTFELFVVPVGRHDGAQHYEAVFTRL